jgi:hypothetical protein
MDGDIAERVPDMSRSHRSILDMIATPAGPPKAEPEILPPAMPAGASEPPEAADFDRADPLPRADDPYRAYGRAGNKPLTTLFLLPKGQLPDGFAYANLERVTMRAADSPGGSPLLVLRFAGSVVSEVRIAGRQLANLCNLIGQHRVPWVRQLPNGRDFSDDAETVITAITITEK